MTDAPFNVILEYASTEGKYNEFISFREIISFYGKNKSGLKE